MGVQYPSLGMKSLTVMGINRAVMNDNPRCCLYNFVTCVSQAKNRALFGRFLAQGRLFGHSSLLVAPTRLLRSHLSQKYGSTAQAKAMHRLFFSSMVLLLGLGIGLDSPLPLVAGQRHHEKMHFAQYDFKYDLLSVFH